MPLQAQTDTLSAVGTEDTSYMEETYQAPNINPIYYFGSPFCKHFAELKLYLGPTDIGLGLNYTYLPEVWGGHVTGYVHNNLWVLVGPEYRLSKPWSDTDWHLYGSVGISHDMDFGTTQPAMEIGVRAGSTDRDGGFCFNSGSLGIMTDFESVYLTIGASLSVSAILTLLLLM